MKASRVLILPSLLFALASCASESHRTVATETVATYGTDYSGPRTSMAIGKFQNSSPYMRGIFSAGEDRLGNQAKTILKTHLSQTNRFSLVDRDNMKEIEREANISGADQQLMGARYVITGQVTEFGRKEVGDKALFGILGRGKTQVAYSKVSVNLVDVRTS
ncbi:MAG: CsgG/HfaB family protein, partial [Planctomycetota bacterium]